LLNKIFDDKGRVREDACPVAIWQLRQLSEYFYKLALDFDLETLTASEEKFVENDLLLDGFDQDLKVADRLRKDFETHFDCSKSLPHHVLASAAPRSGPGTFSGCTSFWYTFKERSDTVHGYTAHYRAMSGYFKPYPGSPIRMKLLKSDTSEVSELLFVPKDSRGPRTIVREPFHRLKAHLGFFDWFSSQLNANSNGRVNFHDQQINRDLAKRASVTKEWATIDLKNASDSVSYRIVKKIFENSPAIRFFVNQRTSYVKLKSGRLHKLRKLAGMGSGLTFPTLSLLCYLGSIRAICDSTRRPYSSVKKEVYVYGDDIIIPSMYCGIVTQFLARIGLNVNSGKSYVRGHFRESCGGDYFKGNDVAPTRLKLSGCKLQVDGFVLSSKDNNMFALNLERHSRECKLAFLDNVAEVYYAALETAYGPLPQGCGDTPYFCRYNRQGVDHLIDPQTGEYLHIRCILPVPRLKAFDRDPYKFLGDFFKKSRGEDTLDYLNRSQGGSTIDVVSIPRTVSLVRKKLSSFALMG